MSHPGFMAAPCRRPWSYCGLAALAQVVVALPRVDGDAELFVQWQRFNLANIAPQFTFWCFLWSFLLDHAWSSISQKKTMAFCSASAMRRCSSLVRSCFVLWGSKNIKQWPCNGWTRVNKPSTKNLANDQLHAWDEVLGIGVRQIAWEPTCSHEMHEKPRSQHPQHQIHKSNKSEQQATVRCYLLSLI